MSDRDDFIQMLKQLEGALDAGLIAEKECQEKRQTILSKMQENLKAEDAS